MMPWRRRALLPEEAAEGAVAAIGCGYDLCSDLFLNSCKPAPDGSRLIELDPTPVYDLALPGGVVVPDVPRAIKCDKGERIRFRSDVVSFHQMAQQFNQLQSLSGKIPSGLFNAMFNFSGCWQKDASGTKGLGLDGWFITLYNIELVSSHVVLRDEVRKDVPSTWDPAALAAFIEKYGTHIVVGVKMGGKDVVHIKQQKDSLLQQTDVQNLLKKLVDERFSENKNEDLAIQDYELSRKMKDKGLDGREISSAIFKSLTSSDIKHHKDDIVSVTVRRGGVDNGQSHKTWISTIPQSPTVISMSFIPITSVLHGVHGSGFLNHAINLYLRYKPPIEELHYFLEFQVPRQWAPPFCDLPLGPQHKKHNLQALQFTLLGPRLYVNTTQVDSGRRPVTGIRLYLEGKKNNILAIHLQHLSTLPDIFQLSDDTTCIDNNISSIGQDYYVPVKWTLLSHVCTAPAQCSGAFMDDSAYVVTKACLEVRETGMRKVLFLRLAFSNVHSMKIRRSEWDGPTMISGKLAISTLFSSRFSTGLIPEPKPMVEINSAIFPKGPPVPIRVPKMSRFVDTTEMTRGPDDQPGYWVVTGAKLCVQGGQIALKTKFSLLVPMPEDDI